MKQTPEAPPLPVAEFDRLVEDLKKDVDRTLIRENMKLTIEDRLIQLMRLQDFAGELRRAGRAAFRR